MTRFYEGIRNIAGVTVYGDFSGERTAVVALNIRDYDSGAVADALYEDYDIAVRAGAHCAPRMHMALGTGDRGAVRFSFSWFNTEEEVDTAVKAVAALAKE
jgi:selenocysteine lyase/cysteine desulfurase